MTISDGSSDYNAGLRIVVANHRSVDENSRYGWMRFGDEPNASGTDGSISHYKTVYADEMSLNSYTKVEIDIDAVLSLRSDEQTKYLIVAVGSPAGGSLCITGMHFEK